MLVCHSLCIYMLCDKLKKRLCKPIKVFFSCIGTKKVNLVQVIANPLFPPFVYEPGCTQSKGASGDMK